MVHEVVLLDGASKDLRALGIYIADEAGETIANKYLDRLYAACMSLAHFPERARSATIFCRACAQSVLNAG